ncbi:MAG: trypsin-like peptidase domain-containing protein [Eubacteriales bacterium]|nr:trypsin-like peptidase domain-containing protein [Eubacteriales bacterium]
MSDFDFGDKKDTQDNSIYHNRTNNENDIEVTASEEEIERTPYADSTYHYAGNPYKESSDFYGNPDRKSNYQRGGGSAYQSYDSGYGYNSYVPEDPGKRRRGGLGKKIAKLAGAALIFGVVAGVGFAGVNVVKDRFFPSRTNKIEATTIQKGDSGSVASMVEQAVADVVDGVMPSVVSITSKIQRQAYFGFGVQESEGAGSGFLLAKTDDKLMIATNNHVVEGAKELTVGFSDNTSAPATLVGADSDADLAVIAVNVKDISDDTISKIKIAVLGDSDSLKVGESVVAIGNALGYGQSVTTGVISAKNREVSFTDGTMTLLQTDAAINPGNSGGVLVNMEGQVVGINNAKLEDTSVEGMGYAIPISTAQVVLTDIMNARTIPEGEGAFLGIIGKTIDAQYSAALGIPNGIYVSQVIKGSPAEEAGIEAGDVIVGFDGNTVSTMHGLKEKISLKEAGTKVELTLKRANQNGEYEEQKVQVTLGKESEYEEDTEDSEQSGQPNTSTQQEDYYYYEGNPFNGGFGNGFYNYFR